MGRPRLVYVATHPVSADLLLRGQLAFMRENGFEVSVVAAPGEALQRVAERERVATFGVRLSRGVEPHRDALALGQLVRLLRELRPDIVNAGTPKAGLLGMMAARAVGVPVRIYLLRGLRLETVKGPMRSVLAVTERIASRCAHDVVCVSPSLLKLSVEGGYIPRKKAIVVGTGSSNGVDTERFRKTDELRARGGHLLAELGIAPTDRVVGFVGRLVSDKGVRDVLAAFEHARREVPDAKLVLLGGDLGDEAIDPALRRAVNDAPGVASTGHIADLAPYYARMDVLAFPSYREGFPNVPLEAACAEVPVVGFRSTGVVDAVVDGVTGTLVAQGDVAALARGITGYLQSPDLSAAHGRAARTRAEQHFSRRVVWGAWLDLYRQRLRERAATS